jgi:hypothetical protein
MDDIARLPLADRTDLFMATADRRALTAAIIEKDFWVCWTLERIFTLPDPPAGLLFKGGTSLSKVFGVIERFSEDVDLFFNRAGLGFGGESDPLNASTGKKRKQGLEALTETCQRVIRERLLPQLMYAFGDALGEPHWQGGVWNWTKMTRMVRRCCFATRQEIGPALPTNQPISGPS